MARRPLPLNKRDLKGDILPPSSKYKDSMNLILNNLPAIGVNIDYNLFQGSPHPIKSFYTWNYVTHTANQEYVTCHVKSLRTAIYIA